MIRDWKDKAQALVDAHHSKHPHGDPSVAHVSMRVRVDESGNIVNLPLKGPNDKAEAIISRYREEFGSNTTEAEFMATIEAIWPNLPKPPLGYILAEDKVVPIQDEKDTTTPCLGEPGWITCASSQSAFEVDLQAVLAKHVKASDINAPHDIMAGYLADCLRSFNRTFWLQKQQHGVDYNARYARMEAHLRDVLPDEEVDRLLEGEG